jgi:hypothetical protein
MESHRVHRALGIALYHHAGYLKSFEQDERTRLQRAYDIMDCVDEKLAPHWEELWRLVPWSGKPSAEARAVCQIGTLPHLQAALTRLLRLIPTYIALPLRIVPPTAWSADETYETFRDQVYIKMGDLRMPYLTSDEIAEELREGRDLNRYCAHYRHSQI